jgi:hypothetical protein
MGSGAGRDRNRLLSPAAVVTVTEVNHEREDQKGLKDDRQMRSMSLMAVRVDPLAHRNCWLLKALRSRGVPAGATRSIR